ncbi:MAG: T9SS type A sorting domain-containing protein, partial [Paludibacteraceae bacterium]|nr:T9SS type A sorting domain-containing protein [Paludibacteraceae bacterium]
FKQDGGDSVQVVGIDSAIVSISYTWENAETVDVDWNPHQPDGINVEIAEWNKTVSFDGKPTEVGEFVYHIATVSIEDSIFVKTGMIKVLDSTVSHNVKVTTVGVGDAVVIPSVTRCGEKSVLYFNSPSATTVHLTVLSATGTKVAEMDIDAVEGYNSAVLPLNRLSSGIYLVKVGANDYSKVLKIQIK